VDLERMERNIARMAAFAREHGLTLRPHTKSHKTAAIARRQIAAGAGGRKASELASLRGVRAYATSEVDALPGSPDVDAVLIASANPAHAPQTLLAASTGKHACSRALSICTN
jgi:D-serine deaminase-like pyridoxal phosphate-dependent protein